MKLLCSRSNSIFYLTVYFDKNVKEREILEFDSDKFEDEDGFFGIANVRSGMCNLSIGYFLSDTKLTVLLPEYCYSCQKSDDCSREFGEQIIRKINEKDKGKVTYLLR